MKVAREREDLRNLSVDDLKEKVNSFRKELFSLRLNASTAHVKDYSQFGKLRRTIARALTYLRQKQSDV